MAWVMTVLVSSQVANAVCAFPKRSQGQNSSPSMRDHIPSEPLHEYWLMEVRINPTPKLRTPTAAHLRRLWKPSLNVEQTDKHKRGKCMCVDVHTYI